VFLTKAVSSGGDCNAVSTTTSPKIGKYCEPLMMSAHTYLARESGDYWVQCLLFRM
jgi:hypothetical protein